MLIKGRVSFCLNYFLFCTENSCKVLLIKVVTVHVYIYGSR